VSAFRNDALESLVGPDVPLLRLDNDDIDLLEELLEAVAAVASQGAFTMGDELAAFESEFADYCEARHAVGVSSGTEALVLALRALGIGAGDEVIVPANSFIATAEAVSLVGATPRLVDVDPETHLLTAEIVAAALTPQVRCIVPVHLYGATVDLAPILELAEAADIPVVEDTAQAHGARYRGRRVGTLGAIGCFSFYPTKNLGAWGDGGAIVTDDAELADRVMLLRSHGERPRYHHKMPGTTARLDAIQAAVLRRKLARLDRWNARRRELGARLRAGLRDAPVELIAPPFAGADHVYHLFVVRSDDRDALRDHLAEHGIHSAVHYPVPIHLTEAYTTTGDGPGSLPAAEDLARRVCSLPLWPGMSDAEADRVIDAVRSFSHRDATVRSLPARRFGRSTEAENSTGRS
jgi:dTDP-3-amino-3,4,6-trideoxy-alpha-D-glucose transaminase